MGSQFDWTRTSDEGNYVSLTTLRYLQNGFMCLTAMSIALILFPFEWTTRPLGYACWLLMGLGFVYWLVKRDSFEMEEIPGVTQGEVFWAFVMMIGMGTSFAWYASEPGLYSLRGDQGSLLGAAFALGLSVFFTMMLFVVNILRFRHILIAPAAITILYYIVLSGYALKPYGTLVLAGVVFVWSAVTLNSWKLFKSTAFYWAMLLASFVGGVAAYQGFSQHEWFYTASSIDVRVLHTGLFAGSLAVLFSKLLDGTRVAIAGRESHFQWYLAWKSRLAFVCVCALVGGLNAVGAYRTVMAMICFGSFTFLVLCFSQLKKMSLKFTPEKVAASDRD